MFLCGFVVCKCVRASPVSFPGGHSGVRLWSWGGGGVTKASLLAAAGKCQQM